MNFNLENLTAELGQMLPCDSAVVGLSGGLDSIALLHALSQLRQNSQLDFELRAMHVHHGLHVEADAWQEFCEGFCQDYSITLEVMRVHVDIGEPGSTAGLEAAARDARYGAFESSLQHGEALLLAHHQDDQLETFLLRLMRGAGTRGLAGMPRYRLLGSGFLYRPLLKFSRTTLQDYATQQGLKWVEDSSNQEIQFDRNYCRHELLPLIESRWPQYRQSWSKSLALVNEADALLRELAEIDLDWVGTDSASVISIERLLQLTQMRQRNALRHWIEDLGLGEPGWNRLQQLSSEVLLAGPDSAASMNCGSYQLQRFKQMLHALHLLQPIDGSQQYDWNPEQQGELELDNNGSLTVHMDTGVGLLVAADASNYQVRYRQGGEHCQLAGRPNKSLKKLLQENEIPPWLRDRIPLIYSQDQLICIPGIGIAEGCTAKPGEPGISIIWDSPQFAVTDH